MNHIVLQYYMKVCDTGSMARAAEQLSLSRQALSKAILTLENEVGVKLFKRKSSGLECTPAGEVFYRHVGILLNDWDRALKELEPFKWDRQTLLRVGYGQMTYNLWEPGHAEAFSLAHPEVRFTYEILPPEQLLRRLDEGQLDLIITGDPSDSEDTFSVPLKRLPYFILLREDDPLAQKEEICLSDLAQRAVLLRASPWVTENIRKAFQLEGLEAEFLPFPSHDPLTLLRVIRSTGAVFFDTHLHDLYRDMMAGLRAIPFRYEGPLPLAALDILATARKERQEDLILRQYIRYMMEQVPELKRN